jgi:nitroreductase
VISPGEREILVAEAARAPSVHNVQPARWRFRPDNHLVLFRAIGRELPVGDPSGHDLQVSLGAAFEGMSIALSRRGYRLGAPHRELNATARGCEPVVTALIEAGAAPDDLAPFVDARRSYRGKFNAASEQGRESLSRLRAGDAHVVFDRQSIAQVAALHDRATWTFESRKDYHAELWSWLRLSKDDPNWSRDGLNADCLALNGAERIAAKLLLEPRIFRALTAMHAAKAVISEAAQVKSATAIVLFTPQRSISPFDVGRRFYRLWLEITRAGLYAAPMSACADDEQVNAMLRDDYVISPERRIANVLRVGSVTPEKVATSPRLPTNEWLV